MPLRPSPMHYSCSACGWRKTVAPLSDALGVDDFYSDCPQCGHTPLDIRSAGAATALGSLAKVVQSIERRLKSLR